MFLSVFCVFLGHSESPPPLPARQQKKQNIGADVIRKIPPPLPPPLPVNAKNGRKTRKPAPPPPDGYTDHSEDILNRSTQSLATYPSSDNFYTSDENVQFSSSYSAGGIGPFSTDRRRPDRLAYADDPAFVGSHSMSRSNYYYGGNSSHGNGGISSGRGIPDTPQQLPQPPATSYHGYSTASTNPPGFSYKDRSESLTFVNPYPDAQGLYSRSVPNFAYHRSVSMSTGALSGGQNTCDSGIGSEGNGSQERLMGYKSHSRGSVHSSGSAENMDIMCQGHTEVNGVGFQTLEGV